jgi:hypothetical protein
MPNTNKKIYPRPEAIFFWSCKVDNCNREHGIQSIKQRTKSFGPEHSRNPELLTKPIVVTAFLITPDEKRRLDNVCTQIVKIDNCPTDKFFKDSRVDNSDQGKKDFVNFMESVVKFIVKNVDKISEFRPVFDHQACHKSFKKTFNRYKKNKLSQLNPTTSPADAEIQKALNIIQFHME